jgi:hypothetical protein
MTHASEVLTDLVHDMTAGGAEEASPARPSGPVEYPPFASNTQGRLIRHAGTGVYCQHCVGSPSERLYFKVCDASNCGKKESDWYYYDSPGDYTRHTEREVPDAVVRKWEDQRRLVVQSIN